MKFSKRVISIPVLRPGEVLIEVTCCTICGSDVHTFCGHRHAPEGCVLGHEVIGKVLGWGNESPPRDFHGEVLSIGNRVTWAIAVGCGSCYFCNNNLSQKCQTLFKYGHEPGGKDVPTGGLSQYCILVPGTAIFRIPAALPDLVACPANCATATVCAAMRLVAETHVVQDSSVLVIGAGMLGLTAAAQLCDAAARHIIVGDIEPERLSRASLFGATHCINTSDRARLESTLHELTDGRGVDIVMDFAGTLPAVETAFRVARTGGCVLLAGSVFPSDALNLVPESIVRRMLTIRGLHNYLPADLAEGLRFLSRAQGQFPFVDLVSKTFSLDQVQQAFEFARDTRPVRVAIRAKS